MSTTLDALNDANAAGAGDRADQNFESVSPAASFARHKSFVSGLTLALYEGLSPITGTQISAYSATLTASATSYVYLGSDDVVHVATSAPGGWPFSMTDKYALGKAVAGASTYVWTDYRRLGFSLSALLAALGFSTFSYDGTNITLTMASDGKSLLLGPFA